VKRRGWQCGQYVCDGRGLQYRPLNGFTLQHQLLQTIDLLLNSTLLLQIRIDLLAQGTDLRLGVGTHPWYAGKLAIHQLAAHQVLGLDRCQQG
jgi:hypothetical protein